MKGKSESLAKVGGVFGGDALDLLLHAADVVDVGGHHGAVETGIHILGLLGILRPYHATARRKVYRNFASRKL